MRKRINRAVAIREASREAGKLGRVIKSVLGTQTERFIMTYIRTPEGDILTDELEIHELVTQHFNEWFAIPEFAQNSLLHMSPTWHTSVDSEEAFLEATSTSGVPEELRRKLYPSLRHDAYPQANAEMRASFASPPTLEEFTHAIKNLPTNSASGPTGLTYNMMKRWSPQVVEAAHRALNVQFKEMHIPEWWRWKWLAPLPKTQDPIPALADLRPLVLLEALRKVWTKIIVGRMTKVWHHHNIIHESQHGSIHHRSTASASLQHINAIEEAREFRVPLHRSSWDMSRAFDTLSRPVKILCWIRAGAPVELAEYLVGMDTPGINIVRSSLALRTWSESGYSGFRVDHRVPEYLTPIDRTGSLISTFIAERGTGQGDNPSPSLWAAFLDILARTLARFDIVNSHTVTVVNGNIEVIIETMYVDDIESKTSTAHGMQNRADTIAAFAMIFGIKFSERKFRRGVMNCPSGGNEPSTMTIRGPEWTPIAIPIRRTGASSYLGGLYDLEYSGVEVKAEMMKIARAACAAIKATKASPETKLMVATVSVIKKIGYKGALASITLQDYKDIDAVFNDMYRTITKNMNSFPTALLYTPRHLGGLGIPQFSVAVQQKKLRMLMAGLAEDGRQKDTAESLLSRVGRMSGVDFTSGRLNYIDTIPDKAHRCWAGSLVEHLMEAGLYVMRHGEQMPLQDEPVHRILQLTNNESKELWSRGVRVMGDLVRSGTTHNGCGFVASTF